MSATTHCIYRNDLAELNRLAADIERFAADNNMDPSVAHAFNLCLDEVFTNIVSYGFTPGQHHEVKLELRANPREFVAIIRDDGNAFDPLSQAPQPDLHAPIEHRKIGGLGVYFVKTLMSRVHYRREHNWNVLEMASARTPREP
jgi:anti-sigma regulatory factor (Ser/Thr protein kinase)